MFLNLRTHSTIITGTNETSVGALLTWSGFCWLLAAVLRIHCRFWSDMTRLGCSRLEVEPMVMVAGVGANPEPGLGTGMETGLLAKGKG